MEFGPPPVGATLPRMRLGIDLDGVVANFGAGWTNFYNQEFGTSLGEHDINTWDAIVPLTHFRSMREFWTWARNLNGASLFRHLDTYPEAVPSLWDLVRQKHDVVIITTKPPWAIHDTFAWLSENKIPTREVHITDAKYEVDCDIYLDDAPHHIYSIHQERPDRVMTRFARPWNHTVSGTESVSNWPEFLALVKSYSG